MNIFSLGIGSKQRTVCNLVLEFYVKSDTDLWNTIV